MKKFFSLLFLFCFLYLIAQSQDTLKITSGEWSTEVNINPLNGQIALNNVINQIKFRYVSSNGRVHRFAIVANTVNKKVEMKDPYGYDAVDQEARQNSYILGFNYGHEKHFKGTKRLSPYIGGEFALAFKRSYQMDEDNQENDKTKISGAWLSAEYYYTQYGYSIHYTYGERGYSSFGLNLILGFDYYVSNKLFVGFEFLYSLNYLKYQKLKVDEDILSIPDTKENEIQFGPKILNGIRIGYVF